MQRVKNAEFACKLSKGPRQVEVKLLLERSFMILNISRNMSFPTVACETNKASDQPAHMRILIRGFANFL